MLNFSISAYDLEKTFGVSLFDGSVQVVNYRIFSANGLSRNLLFGA